MADESTNKVTDKVGETVDKLKPKRVLGTGASGDPENQEQGGPWSGLTPKVELPQPGETPKVDGVPQVPAGLDEALPQRSRRGSQPTD